MTRIKIEKHETKEFEFGVKHAIIDGKNRYEFFETKKDGGETKAFEQYKSLGLRMGSECEAEIKEEPYNFLDKKTGATVGGVRKTIIYFNEGVSTPPKAREETTYADTNLERIEAKLDTVIRGIARLLGTQGNKSTEGIVNLNTEEAEEDPRPY